MGGMAGTTTRRSVERLRGTAWTSTPDDLAVEAPLFLVLDDVVIAVLMRTPGHDLELTAGWLLVESGVRTMRTVSTVSTVRTVTTGCT